MVRATIRPPAFAGALARPAAGGARVRGRTASMVRTFQLSGRPAAALMSTNRSISSSVNWSRQPATIASSWVPSCSPTARERASSSAGSACREATGLPVAVGVGGGLGGGQAPARRRPWRRGRARSIGVELLGRRLPADRVRPHHVPAQRAVADHEARVDGDPPFEGVEVLAEGVPGPVDALLQGGQGHALDPATSCGGCSRRPRAVRAAAARA